MLKIWTRSNCLLSTSYRISVSRGNNQVKPFYWRLNSRKSLEKIYIRSISKLRSLTRLKFPSRKLFRNKTLETRPRCQFLRLMKQSNLDDRQNESQQSFYLVHGVNIPQTTSERISREFYAMNRGFNQGAPPIIVQYYTKYQGNSRSNITKCLECTA